MKKLSSALVIAVASVTLVVPAAPATAGGCVSRGEFRQVHRGMPISRVHRVFDTRGRLDLRVGRISIRKYNPCPRRSAVSVTFRRGRLTAKVGIFRR
jgi:hypothetical protein